MLQRAGGDLVHLLDVLAVDLHGLHSERLGALAEVTDRRVLALRRRLGPVVVLADEQGRNGPELGEVERLVEGADVRRPVAEERAPDPRLAAELEGERGADDRRQAAADDGVRAEIAALDVVEVHRPAVPVRAALELPVELGHQLIRMRALCERVPMRAVRRGNHVAVGKRAADADSDRLLPDRDVQEPRQLAGAEALLDLLLEAPDQEHLPEELAQGLLGDPAALFDFRHGRDSTLRAMRLVEHFESGLPGRRQSERLRLVEQFRQLMSTLPDDWQSARLRLIVGNEEDGARAAALLGPTNPGRRG